MPAGPAPTTSAARSAFAALVKSSGCQPRRNSSPAVAFWMHPTWLYDSSRAMQTFDPVHSRISSRRPSRIFVGQERVGDRGAGGADDVERTRPDDLGHEVSRRVAADTDHGLVGRLADAVGPRTLVTLGVVARRS